MKHVLVASLLFVGTFLFLADARASTLTDQVSLQIQNRLGAISPQVDSENALREVLPSSRIVRFYSGRNFTPAWITDRGLSPLAGAFIDVLQQVQYEGLDPNDYRVPQIEFLLRRYGDSRASSIPPFTPALAELDLLLTQAFLDYASDEIRGRVDPTKLTEGWHSTPRDFDPVLLLQHALGYDRMSRVLQDMQPPHRAYQRLQTLLADYRQQAEQGGWPDVPVEGPLLRPGMFDDRLPAYRRFLTVTGDLAVLTEEPTYYDPPTAEAVRYFQRRHGLKVDGVIGPQTIRAMQVPIEARIEQIKLNMERWRWLPTTLGKRHVKVNIAAFHLDVIEQEEPVLSMAVIVGKDYRQTPVFSDQIRYLEFAPDWRVPPTILKEDLLPEIKKNPAQWFAENPEFSIIPWGAKNRSQRLSPNAIDWDSANSRNFPGLLRHAPGPKNPLGQVKFMFPNRFSVYLHDTTTKHLFTQEKRTYSSGCIRVEKPVQLAEYLLEPQQVSADEIIERMNASKTSRIRLARKMPVHILYWTTWVDDDGVTHFRDDVYQRDQTLKMALENRARRSVQFAGTYQAPFLPVVPGS